MDGLRGSNGSGDTELHNDLNKVEVFFSLILSYPSDLRSIRLAWDNIGKTHRNDLIGSDRFQNIGAQIVDRSGIKAFNTIVDTIRNNASEG